MRTNSPVISQAKKLRVLRRCLSELQALYAEAVEILANLLVSPSADIVRSLCARFQILQEYFVMRYREAKAHAISSLGGVKATYYFP